MAGIWTRALAALGEEGGDRASRAAEFCGIGAGLLAMTLYTMPDLSAGGREACTAVLLACLALFVVEAIWRAARWPRADGGWRAGVRSALPRLAPVLPMALLAPFAWTPSGAPLLAVLWLARLAPYTPGFPMLGRVLRREREPIVAALVLFSITLFLAAVLAFLAEREAQPDAFGSVPQALWWAITTLTTTGYGDKVPVTLAGRVVGGLVMVSGIVVFALLAGIVATGFAVELRRRDFLRTYEAVARVPFFVDAGTEAVFEVAGLLRPRHVAAGTVLTRKGQAGDSMFFIVSGDVEVRLDDGRVIALPKGSFFGEIAILTGGPRTATAVAMRPSDLLVLDVADFRSLAAKRPDLADAIAAEARRRMAGATAAPGGTPVS
jgi:voltage-gated potassium channel